MKNYAREIYDMWCWNEHKEPSKLKDRIISVLLEVEPTCWWLLTHPDLLCLPMIWLFCLMNSTYSFKNLN